MADYTLVQKASAAGEGTATPVLGSAPTVGNLLVATYFSRATTAQLATGFTQAVLINNATEADQLKIAYRIVLSGDGTSWVFGDGTDAESVTIMEWAPPTGKIWDSTALDKVASTGRTASVTSLSSGTTAATTEAAALSIVAIGLRDGGTSPSWSNSFTQEADVQGGTSIAQTITGWHIETATGTKTSTCSWTTARTAMGAIAVFKAVGGAVSVALTASANATGSAGSLAASVSTALSGNAGTTASGTLVPSSAYSVAISGNQATGSSGSLAASIKTSLSGNTATGASGALAASISKALAGNAGTGGIGDLTPSSSYSVAISGNEATAASGSLSVSVSTAIVGNEATGSAGSVTVSSSVVVTPETFSGGYEQNALWNPHYLVRKRELEQELREEVIEAIEEVAKLDLPIKSAEIALRIKTREFDWQGFYFDIQQDLQQAIRLDLASSLQELRGIRLQEFEMMRVRENNRRIAIVMMF